MMRLIVIVMFSWMTLLPVTTIHAGQFTVGVIPQYDVRKLNRIWRPILTEVEKLTGHSFVFRGSPTIADFEKEFNDGAFDFAYMNPYHVLMANKSQGYIPLVRDTGRQLYGVIVVKKGSEIKKVEDLEGKTVAFPAPNALAASLMIRADLENKFNVKVKPSYVKTHSSVYLNVLLGVTIAGGGVQKTLAQQQDDIRNNLEVIYMTEKVTPHPFVAHPRVAEKVRMQVKQAILKLAETDYGNNLLSKVPVKKIGSASLADYEVLEKMGLDKFYVEN